MHKEGKKEKKELDKRFKIMLVCLIALSVLAFVIVMFSFTGKVIENDSAELETTEEGSSGDGGDSGDITSTPTQGKDCAMEPACSGRYSIGMDENNCPIYECPTCNHGTLKYYTCPNGKQVEWCFCKLGLWTCANSPEQECDDTDTLITEEETATSSSAGGGGGSSSSTSETLVCPSECICNGDTIACSYSGETTTQTATAEGGKKGEEIKFCPAGCLCNKEQIVCNTEITSKGSCAMGCELEGQCILPGIRTTVQGSKQYCDINAEWKKQKTKSESCDNNFECETNLCIDGNCITHNFFQRIFSWFGSLFGGKDD